MKRIRISFPIYVPNLLIRWQLNWLLRKKILIICPKCKQVIKNGNFCGLCGYKLKA